MFGKLIAHLRDARFFWFRYFVRLRYSWPPTRLPVILILTTSANEKALRRSSTGGDCGTEAGGPRPLRSVVSDRCAGRRHGRTHARLHHGSSSSRRSRGLPSQLSHRTL